MGLNRQDKAAVIEEVAGIVSQSSAIVIAEYREKKANDNAAEKDNSPILAPLRRAVVKKQSKDDETNEDTE